MDTSTTNQAFAKTRRLLASWQDAVRLWIQQPSQTNLELREEAHAAYQAEQQRTLHAAAPKLPTTPYGTRLGFTTKSQYLDFIAKQPRVLPMWPATPAALPALAATHRRAETYCLVGLCLLLALAGWAH
jgi:hypothetical protein